MHRLLDQQYISTSPHNRLINDNLELSVQNIYLKILSRLPSEQEKSDTIKYISVDEEKRIGRLTRFAQNLLISNEFIFRD